MITKLFVIVVIYCLSVIALDIVELPDTVDKQSFVIDSYPYHHTSIHTDLLKDVERDLHTFDTIKRHKIQELKEVIKELANNLMKEEITLQKMKPKISALKKDFFWFFNETTRLRVDELQLEVNDQVRVIENILDDIIFKWNRLKPLYGIYSKMFLTEALGFIPYIWKVGMDVFATLLELGLISWLLFGSLTGFLLSLFATLGFSFFPSVIGFSTLLVNIYWVFKLPFIMIQYSPTLTDFLTVYFAFVGVLMTITFAVFRLVFPDQLKLKIMDRS